MTNRKRLFVLGTSCQIAVHAPGGDDDELVQLCHAELQRIESRFSTRHRNRPQGRYLPQQPPGWVETVTDMTIGEKRLVWIPPDAGYAGRGAKPTETMVYEIELVEIEAAPIPPENLTAPPADASKTASGIVIPDTAAEKPDQGEVLAVGKGKKTDDGKLIALDVKVGDKVLFGKYSGQTVKVKGDELLVMREEDIMGVLEAA